MNKNENCNIYIIYAILNNNRICTKECVGGCKVPNPSHLPSHLDDTSTSVGISHATNEIIVPIGYDSFIGRV